MKTYNSKISRLHLFPTPTMWTGLGSMIDVYGTLNMYNYSPSDAKADYDALRSDWLAVGDYITEAIISEYDDIVRTNKWAKTTT